jgi:hypothetical protein
MMRVILPLLFLYHDGYSKLYVKRNIVFVCMLYLASRKYTTTEKILVSALKDNTSEIPMYSNMGIEV